MNDRSQAGSSLKDGRIELLQNRRCNFEDYKGLVETLDEDVLNLDGTWWLDKHGNTRGLTVPASYYVQLFNREKRPSLQRVMQQLVESPLQSFYAFDAEVTQEGSTTVEQQGLFELLRATGFTPEVKLRLYFETKNVIKMRIENLMD